MSFLRQFSVICVHMHIEWYYARGVGLHFYAAVFTPPSRLHSFHPVLGQHLCSHSSHINPVCWGPSPAPPPLSSPEPPPLHHPVSQLILVSVMGHIWHRSKACSRHIPLRVETTRLFLTVKSQEEWMFACMFLMICLWAYLLAFWAIPPSVPCIPPLSQQPCRLLPGLYFGDIAVVMNHSRRDWRGLPRCSKESNAIYTLHHSHASSHPCPYPSLCSAPHQFVSTDSDWSHHTLMCMSAFLWFSIDGKFGLVENVTEEVQSLRNRVELLEKVHRKTQEHMFNHIKATYSDTSQSGSPGKPLSLVCDLTS